ncbi:integrase catalytic domain-containing protein [Trichonephila clavipes]|nr:integrase catalytic domain-containing protein [Trichonephila clavipes]
MTLAPSFIPTCYTRAFGDGPSNFEPWSKAYNRVEELIALENVDICKLEAELNVFKRKVDCLENTHSNILELLPEKDYDAEFAVVEDFRDKAIRIQTKARRIINGQQNVCSVLNSTNDVCVAMYSVRNVVIDKKNFQLSKLELRKFDGGIREWLYFWSQFEKIHVDSSIEKIQINFNIYYNLPLKGLVLEKIVKITSEKNANPNFNSNNLCTLYDNSEQQICALETLGVPTDKCARLLYPSVESCMPEDLLRAFYRGLNFDSGDDSEKRIDTLLKLLKT